MDHPDSIGSSNLQPFNSNLMNRDYGNISKNFGGHGIYDLNDLSKVIKTQLTERSDKTRSLGEKIFSRLPNSLNDVLLNKKVEKLNKLTASLESPNINYKERQSMMDQIGKLASTPGVKAHFFQNALKKEIDEFKGDVERLCAELKDCGAKFDLRQEDIRLEGNPVVLKNDLIHLNLEADIMEQGKLQKEIEEMELHGVQDQDAYATLKANLREMSIGLLNDKITLVIKELKDLSIMLMETPFESEISNIKRSLESTVSGFRK